MNNDLKPQPDAAEVADASCEHHNVPCPGRREFLVRATTTVGGLVLGLSVLRPRTALAQDPVPAAPTAPTAPTTPATPAVPAAPEVPAPPPVPDADDFTLTFDKDSPLNKVGGSQVVETKAGKILIVRTAETTFAATSAICTHRGAVVGYDDATKQIVCPKHGARFDLKGAVKKGPAQQPLPEFKAFPTATGAFISLEAEAA